MTVKMIIAVDISCHKIDFQIGIRKQSAIVTVIDRFATHNITIACTGAAVANGL